MLFLRPRIEAHSKLYSFNHPKSNHNKLLLLLLIHQATHLQAFKPKLSTYDQLLKNDQQNVSLYVCVHKLKHFQPHSLLCHLWCIIFCNLFDIYIWSFEKLTKQLRQTFFFSSYIISFTLLIDCFNTIILAEQSLHHNIILEKLDHCWVNGICTKKVISYSPTLSLNHK